MNKLFKIGELVLYSRSCKSEGKLCIVLDHIFISDDSNYFDNDGINYFRCLIDNKAETICDIFLRKVC